MACGSQAFIATLCFDPSMPAPPIIDTQKSQSVGVVIIKIHHDNNANDNNSGNNNSHPALMLQGATCGSFDGSGTRSSWPDA